MNNLNKTICPLPWIHFATRPNGDVRLCCTSNASGAGIIDSKSIGLVSNDDTIYNLNYSTIEDVWNSKFMRDVRLQMLNDQIPPSCRKCFEEESNGIVSKRQWETNVWKDRVDLNSIINSTADDGTLPVYIPYFDLRLGNVCQLKCVMCSPHDSSSWVNDWKIQSSLYQNEELKIDQQWNSKWDYNWYQTSSFLNSLKSQAMNIKEIYFAGGEPLLIPEHYKILNFLIESGYSNECVIRYNSNGLDVNQKLITLWEEFKEVKFNFSIDAVDDKNEYIRYPSKWVDIVNNLKLLDNSADNITVNIACAVQLLNVLYLPELVEWKISQNFKKINLLPYGAGLIGLHLVYLPSYLNIKVLPMHIKEVVSDKLISFINSQTSESFLNHSYGKQRWQGILNYMNSEDWSHKLPLTIEYLNTLDSIRGTEFRSIFPGLSDL